jgi:hypothetical protein
MYDLYFYCILLGAFVGRHSECMQEALKKLRNFMHTFMLSIFKVYRYKENMNKNNINEIQYFSLFILLFKTLCETLSNHSYPNGSQIKMLCTNAIGLLGEM